jgi:hypothetical protein
MLKPLIWLSLLGTAASFVGLLAITPKPPFVLFFILVSTLLFVLLLCITLLDTIRTRFRNERVNIPSLLNALAFSWGRRDGRDTLTNERRVTEDGSIVSGVHSTDHALALLGPPYGTVTCYISLYPRRCVTSVQLCLVSKLKELQALGVKPVVLLFDIGYSPEDVKAYKRFLRVFLGRYPYCVYSQSDRQDIEGAQGSFKKVFMDVTRTTSLYDLLTLALATYGDQDLTRLESLHRDGLSRIGNTKADWERVFTDFALGDKSVRNILRPLFQLIQFVTLATGRTAGTTVVLSGSNLAEFWTYAETTIGLRFVRILIPLVRSLTSPGYVRSEDTATSLSLMHDSNERIIASDSLRPESVLDHYRSIFF